MKIMQVTAQVEQADIASAEVLVLMHCEGEALAKQGAAPLDRALGGALSKLVQSKEFEGKANEVLLYHTQDKVPAKRLVLVGLGQEKRGHAGDDPASDGLSCKARPSGEGRGLCSRASNGEARQDVMGRSGASDG